ncbi:MAG: hypothetical protein GF419_00060 [Ignavibacteriales bacterium]|nr:hypothetical protein [Ignavibacteriales bacterium]
MAKRVVAERDVADAARRGEAIWLERGDVVTPLARDRAKELGVQLVVGEPSKRLAGEKAPKAAALASDWERRALRALFAKTLERRGWRTIDLGARSDSSDERVAAAARGARELVRGNATFAILLDDVGFAATVANRFRGVRAFVCADEFAAKIARAKYDADALAIPAAILSEEKALAVLDAWLTANDENGDELRAK